MESIFVKRISVYFYSASAIWRFGNTAQPELWAWRQGRGMKMMCNKVAGGCTQLCSRDLYVCTPTRPPLIAPLKQYTTHYVPLSLLTLFIWSHVGGEKKKNLFESWSSQTRITSRRSCANLSWNCTADVLPPPCLPSLWECKDRSGQREMNIPALETPPTCCRPVPQCCHLLSIQLPF